jgi:predicted hydrocarbon binding protein
MSQEQDFERAWLRKFANCLDRVAGEEARTSVMQGSDELSSRSSRQEVIEWSRDAMERLDTLVDEKGRKEIMAGCACQYSPSNLQEIRQTYGTTGDIDLVHRMLQGLFEAFLKDSLELNPDFIQEIVGKGWGLAGTRHGNTIMATKIPKSGYLLEYLQETDPEKKRQMYCHCPRIRDVLKTSVPVSPTYCYCGAGFYKGIWEEILQRPVEVEVLETVLKGDEVCKIALHLPVD